MKLALVALVVLGACAHGPILQLRSTADAQARVDSLYWSAVQQLDPANKSGSLDAAIASLDSYLSSGVRRQHINEAMVLRRLARDAQRLMRVEVALQQARSVADTSPRRDVAQKPRDDDALKEIARLKDELEKANAELERIRKRLAVPTKP